MKNKILAVVGLFGIVCGCSVVNEETKDDCIKRLAGWKYAADNLRGLSFNNGASRTATVKKYKEAQLAVNALIETKKSEIIMAGSSLFTTVDLEEPKAQWNEAESIVSKAIGTEGRDAATVISLIFSVLNPILEAYKEGRVNEAKTVAAQLEAFKWSSWE